MTKHASIESSKLPLSACHGAIAVNRSMRSTIALIVASLDCAMHSTQCDAARFRQKPALLVTSLKSLAVDLLVQQATACGLPEVFHVSPRSRSIAHVLVDLRRAGGAIMPAIDRKCFDCKQTTSHGLVLRVYACQ